MKKLIVGILVISVVLAGRLSANQIFSTFGPADTYNLGTGWTIGHAGDLFDQGDRFSFTGPNPLYLGSIELAVGLVSGTNELDVWLMNDAGGQPGTIIESFGFTGAMGTFGENILVVGNSVLNPLLTPDTPYWLIASVPDDGTWAAWNISSPAILGQHTRRNGAEPWYHPYPATMGAFRINDTSGDVIPAPGAILLGSIGVAFVGWLRRRRTL